MEVKQAFLCHVRVSNGFLEIMKGLLGGLTKGRQAARSTG